MKARILTGWTMMRVLYLVMGITLVIQAIMAAQYMMIALGGYFAVMAVFGIGCMGGNCYTPRVTKKPAHQNSGEVIYEEIKS